MPLHAQIACIGGNCLFAFFFLIAVPGILAEGNIVFALILLMLAIAAGYSVWVLLKFRHYLNAEASLEREVHLEKLQAELAALKAKHEPDAAG